MPLYNGQTYVRRAIESVIAQSFQNWELICVDDGSTDQTPEIVGGFTRADARIRLLRKENGGVATARNFGAKDAIAPSLVFLDQDDELLPHGIRALIQLLDRSPRASAAHGRHGVIDSKGDPIHNSEVEELNKTRPRFTTEGEENSDPDTPTDFTAQGYVNSIYTPGCMIIRKAAFDDIGGFDQALAPSDDWAMTLRLCQKGPLPFLNEAVMNWRDHGQNISHDHQWMVQSTTKVYRLAAEWAPDKYGKLAAVAGLQRLVMPIHRQRLVDILRTLHQDRSPRGALRILKLVRYLVKHRSYCFPMLQEIPLLRRAIPIGSRINRGSPLDKELKKLQRR